MIARFRILLPYIIYVQEGENLAAFKFAQNGYEITIWPLLQSAADAAELVRSKLPLNEIAAKIKPIDKPALSNDTQMNDKGVFECALLQIDFAKPAFERSRMKQTTDPPQELIFKTANDFLMRFRSVSQASQVRPLDVLPAPWTLEYLNDDGSSLAVDPNKFRSKTGMFFKVRLVGLTKAVWDKATSLPLDFTPSAYDRLLLDAEAMLPDLGPAVILTFSALETLISAALNILVEEKRADKDFWEWIQSRNDDYRKEPSVSEEFTVLLRTLSGKSLEDDVSLWQAFKKLRDVRNNFIHSGILATGRKTKTFVGENEVNELIGKAKEIVSFVEMLLPENKRRPILTVQFKWTHTHLLHAEKPQEQKPAT